MRRILPLLILLALQIGCGPRTQEGPAAVYEQARRKYRLANTQEALGGLDRALARGVPGLGEEWYWRLLLLKTQILAATGKAADAVVLLERAVPHGSAHIEAEYRMSLGFARLRLGQLEAARRLLDEAYRIAGGGASPGLIAEIQNRRGTALAILGEREAAETSFRDALENARKAGDPFLEISALGNFGSNRLLASRFDEAIPWYENILPLAEKGGYLISTAMTLHNIGICYYRLGDYAKALGFLGKAEAAYGAAGHLAGLQGCQGDTGNVHYSLRDFKAAASCYRKALELARRAGDDRSAGAWLSNLATVAMEAGDPGLGERYNREAEGLLEKAKDTSGLVYTRLNSARAADARGQAQRSEELYRQAIRDAVKLEVAPALVEAHARLGSLYARNGQWKSAQAQLARLSAAIDSGRARMQRDEWKLTYQSSVVPFYQDYVDLLMDRRRTEDALAAAEACRARVLAEKLGLGGSVGRAGTAGEFRAKAKAAGAALLAYWLAPRRSFLWVVMPGQVSSFTLPPEAEIRGLVESYNNSILNLEDTRDTGNPAGLKLYQTLVAPASRSLAKDSRVVIIPDGPLFELNFETLLAGREAPRYWVEDVTLAVAPSLALLDPAKGSRGFGVKSVLLIGDPVSPAPEYPPLPATAAEIASIRAAFPTRRVATFTRDGAVPEVYRRVGAGSFTFIHFSAHAQANRESPLDSAVILSRSGDTYKLYARDVAEVPLRAELVTISACRGAGARLYSGEGLVGLAWAFFRAGARNVVAGLWDVNDRSTALLMSRVYAEVAAGASPAAALRSAKLALLAEPTFRRPYHWAPFELFTRAGL